MPSPHSSSTPTASYSEPLLQTATLTAAYQYYKQYCNLYIHKKISL